MRLQRVWLIYRADSPLALKEARRCADDLEAIGVTSVLAMCGLTADPFPGLLASEPQLPDLAVVLGGDGTSNDYFPPEVPALPSFKLHKFVSDIIIEKKSDYRTGVIFTTNRRVWEHDKRFLKRLKKTTAIGVDMETATVFSVGHFNEIARGALLLVSDVPLTPEGVKTETSDHQVTQKWVDLHLEIGIKAMTDIGKSGEEIKHFKY